jgi:23S rRNA pseudouridine1911/1915/1917 synthase
MAEPGTTYEIGPKDAGKRLDRFLAERIPALSRSRIQRVIDERVKLSWAERARPSIRLRAGGRIHVGFAPLEETAVDVEVPILDRGPGWIAVNKPACMPVHPVNHTRLNSLISTLRRSTGQDGLRLVHRLDAETSGVLLIGEDADTARELSTAFERREVHKEYLALVSGTVKGDTGVIDAPIGGARDSSVFVRLETGESGKPSITEWRVQRRLEHGTLLRVFPRTGRRHQIRVHLASIGHPLLGDILYGRPDDDYLDLVRGRGDPRRDSGGAPRHLLHSARIVIPDTKIDVIAPLPVDFREFLSEQAPESPE